MEKFFHSLQVFATSIILCACTITSSQLERFSKSDTVEDSQNYFWNVNYDDVNYTVISVVLPNGTLFADKIGNSIYFDGWSIQSVIGFGDFTGELEFQELEIGQFELSYEKTLSGSECSKWKETQLNNQKVFSQTCDGDFHNKITINKLGEINKIEQFLMPYKKKITLTKIIN